MRQSRNCLNWGGVVVFLMHNAKTALIRRHSASGSNGTETKCLTDGIGGHAIAHSLLHVCIHIKFLPSLGKTLGIGNIPSVSSTEGLARILLVVPN